MSCVAEFLRAHPRIKECCACGRCLEVCPTYAASGKETAGPRGRLLLALAMAAKSIQPKEAFAAFADCLHCGKCERACPMSLPLQRLFHAASQDLRRYFKFPLPAKYWQRLLLFYPSVASFLQPPLALAAKTWPAKNLPAIFTRLPTAPFILRKNGELPEKGKRIFFFGGCLTRHFLPEIAAASIATLKEAGYLALSPGKAGCCGRPQLMRGEDIAAGARRNLAILDAETFDWLVTPCPGCLETIVYIWPNLADLPRELRDLARQVAAKSMDMTQFLSVRRNAQREAKKTKTVYWHQPCLMNQEAAQAALRLLAGRYERVVAGQPDSCCGAPLQCVGAAKEAGGEAKSGRNSLARSLAAAARREALRQSAAEIITACPGCVLALRQEMRKAREEMPVAHIAALIAGKPDHEQTRF